MIRLSILLLVFTLTFSSCNNSIKTWDKKIIQSENDVIMVTSIDLMEIIKKVDLANNDQLSLDQKMMYKAFMSTFNNKSLGFNIENQHRLFVLPENGKLNAGVFLVGDIVDKVVFENFLINYFGAESFSGEKPTTCYLKEFDVFVGFNDQFFAAGISPNKDFIESKIQSFFNIERSTISNPSLDKYLSKEDDISCYLSSEELIDYLDDIDNPLIQLQLPNINELRGFGAAVTMAINFEKGVSTIEFNSNFSKKSNNKPYAYSGVDRKYKNYLSDNNELIMFLLMHFNPENITTQLEQFNKLGLLNDVNDVLFSLGTNSNEVLKIIDGQMAFSFLEFPKLNSYENVEDDIYDDENWDDAEFEEDMDTFNEKSSTNNTLPSLLISVGVKDPSNLLSLFNKNNLSIKKDELLSIEQGVNLLLKDNVLHLSSNKTLLEKIENKGGLNKYDKINDDYFKEPFYGNINMDFNKWPKEILNEIFGKSNHEYLMDKIIITSNNEGGMFRVDFTDKNQNSLTTIVDLIIRKKLIENYI